MHASFLRPRLLHLWRLFKGDKGDSKLYFPMQKACGQRIRPCSILRWVSLAVLRVFLEKWPWVKPVKKDFFAFEWLALTQPTFMVSSFTALISLTKLYGPYIVYLYLFMHVQQTAYSDLHNSRAVCLCSVTDQATNPLNLSHLNFTFPSDRFIKTNKTMIIIRRRRDESAKT